jgi:hypothetical protein
LLNAHLSRQQVHFQSLRVQRHLMAASDQIGAVDPKR